MSRRSLWTAVFLALTAGAIGMELVAAFDDSSSTMPWLPLHLWVAKKRRTRARQSQQ